MALYDQLGRPKQFVTTTPSATITDLLDGTGVKMGHESQKHFGNQRFPRRTIGNDATKITLKTTDLTAPNSFYQGAYVEGITITFEGTCETINAAGAVTLNAGTFTYTCSSAIVDESVEITPKADGQPAEFQVVLMPCLKQSDNTVPTQALTLTAGSGE